MAMSTRNELPPTVIPEDPVEALRTIQASCPDVPALLVLSEADSQALANLSTTVENDHPELVAQLGQHKDRSFSALFFVLKNCVDQKGQPVTTQNTVPPVVLHFLTEVSRQGKAPYDPVLSNLNPRTRRNNPALKPVDLFPLNPEFAANAGIELLEQPPAVFVSRTQHAVREQHITLRGTVRADHADTVAALQAELPEHANSTATDDFVKVVSRYVRLHTGASEPETLTAERLHPHYEHYLGQAAIADKLHFDDPYRRALMYTPKQLNALYTKWVHGNGMPAWAFHTAVANKATDIDAYLSRLQPGTLPEASVATNEKDPTSELSQPTTLPNMRRRFSYMSDTLAVATVFDTPLIGTPATDVPRLARHVGVPITSLRRYAETGILKLPKG